MNKQELITRLIKLLEAPSEIEGSDFDHGHNYGIERAILLAEHLNEQQPQMNKQEKPVVPQFVADMIVKRKKQGDSLVATLVNLGAFGDAQRWIRKGDNGDTFAKAWLFGYEVEKEKLYTVEMPNPNGFIRLVLCKDCDGKLFVATFSGGDCWETFGKCKLTEAEIKEDFEWAWQFAEEVKE